MNSSILESKLKRHKISFSHDNGKLIIGKPSTNYTILIGLIILPILAGIGICIYIFLNDFAFAGRNLGKVIAALVLLFGTGFFNLSRVNAKKLSNNNLKTLEEKVINVKNEFGEYVFDSQNIKGFEYHTHQVDQETFEGNLFLVDMKDRKHQILGFDDENEQYAINDLKWFMQYLQNHLGLENE